MSEGLGVSGVMCAQLLCKEMAGAFEARSMTLPPWRQARAMLSKWLPAKVGSPLLFLCAPPIPYGEIEPQRCRSLVLVIRSSRA